MTRGWAALRTGFKTRAGAKPRRIVQAIGCRYGHHAPEMEQAWKGLQRGVEGADVTPEKSADKIGTLRTATTLGHHGGGGPGRHLPKERQD